MTSLSLPTRRQALLACLFAALTVVTCAAMFTAAALAPAPAALVPLVAVLCVGLPMVAAWELPRAVAALRRHGVLRSHDTRAVAELRRSLARIPETAHPLDL
jgi:hypothetical protein